jgi:cell wall-associated NlpC family hydrolase
MSTDGSRRGMPEFRERRTAPPTVVTSFAAQLGARQAAAPPRVVSRLASRPAAGKAGRGLTSTFDLEDPGLRTSGGTRTGGARPTAGRPAGLALVAPSAGGVTTRTKILSQANRLLGVPYVWGGDQSSGMDCSAWVSRVWGVPRQSTDTLQNVADPISKDALKAGDALNLPTWEDPSGHGHVRLFDRWADASKTRMWVYEETADPGRSVHHVIAWDGRYQPMRLRGLD